MEPETVVHPPLAFADRPPSDAELERLRLVMSTYQDGSGQIVKGMNIPFPDGWDFESCITAVFGGTQLPKYDKSIFDVLIPYSHMGNMVKYGLSCKMKGSLAQALKLYGSGTKGRVFIELSNSSSLLWAPIRQLGINQENIGHDDNSARAGLALINTVRAWHSIAANAGVLLDRSYYLSVQWKENPLKFKLYQFPIALPDPASLRWFRSGGIGGGEGKHIKGVGDDGIVFEWYFGSGGQFKYYPRADQAIWSSPEFALESLNREIARYLRDKVEDYFPELWNSTF
ncbi:MAG TPA: hypothetical protein VK610_07390 [Rhodothermales bacterium]|nr:hypothetical protein [Rhodothermales bacterium]